MASGLPTRVCFNNNNNNNNNTMITRRCRIHSVEIGDLAGICRSYSTYRLRTYVRKKLDPRRPRLMVDGSSVVFLSLLTDHSAQSQLSKPRAPFSCHQNRATSCRTRRLLDCGSAWLISLCAGGEIKTGLAFLLATKYNPSNQRTFTTHFPCYSDESK